VLVAKTRVSLSEILAGAGAVTEIASPAPAASRIPKKEVTGKEVYKDVGKIAVREVLTPTQQAGMILASWSGIIIAVLVLIILIHFVYAMAHLPNDPLYGNKAPPATSPSDLEPLVNYYKAVNDLAVDRSIKIFDTVITKTLLPVFTLILGYIFGTKTERSTLPPNGKRSGR
jgi:hypothetical protein